MPRPRKKDENGNGSAVPEPYKNVEEKFEPTAREVRVNGSKTTMTKKLAVFFIVVVVVLVFLGVWIGTALNSSGTGPSAYTAVFLTSGDIYFGKLSWFPWPRLSNAWFLQRGVNQQNQPQLALAPFNSLFWGPAGDVYLNPKQILFWAPVRADSQVAKALENPSSVPPLQQSQEQAPAPSATSTAPVKK